MPSVSLCPGVRKRTLVAAAAVVAAVVAVPASTASAADPDGRPDQIQSAHKLGHQGNYQVHDPNPAKAVSKVARTTARTGAAVRRSVESLIPTSPLSGSAIHQVVSRSGDRTEHVGDDMPQSQAQQRRQVKERQLAMAATWHLDPKLLEPLATDSEDTRAARKKLGRLNRHLGTVMETYDAAQAEAQAAQTDANQARADLEIARASEAAARARYEELHDSLVTIVTETYENGTLGPMTVLASSENGTDFLYGMTVMRHLGESQASATQDADVAAEDLAAATAAVAVAEQVAQAKLAHARDLLEKATVARDEVLDDVNDARLLLEDRVLADQLAASVITSQAAAAAAAQYVANGAKVSFPLPPGAAFVDQHNYAHSSSHWASVHTGDDLSTACGTPVLAAHAGTVIIRTDQSWSGRWLVMVSSGAGKLTTWYAHMEALTVADGQTVKAGQAIGLVGAEGNATGCHLHFEVHPTGGSIYQDNINPGEWLRAVGVYPGKR